MSVSHLGILKFYAFQSQVCLSVRTVMTKIPIMGLVRFSFEIIFVHIAKNYSLVILHGNYETNCCNLADVYVVIVILTYRGYVQGVCTGKLNM